MAESKQKVFLIEKDQKEIIDELTDEEAGIIFKAIFEYVETKNIPILEKTLKIVFKQFKNKLDFFEDKYQQKCLKNKENIEKYWEEKKAKKDDTNEYERIRSYTNVYKIKEKEKENKNKIKENKNKNNNITILSGKSVNGLSQTSELVQNCNSIVSHLNKMTGANYRATAESTKRLLKPLLDDYSVDDIILVIDKMCYLWNREPKRGERDMRIYLRPSTLFRRSNFENYLGMNVPIKAITTNDIAKQIDFNEFK